MATTLKAIIRKSDQRLDKTWKIVIRLTHNRKVRYIPTTMSVGRKDVTASLKIKNQRLLEKCDTLILQYRKIIDSLNIEFNDIDIDTIIHHLKKNKSNVSAISFTAYVEKWLDVHKNLKSLKNYRTAFKALQMFFGRDAILHSDITVKTLKDFCESLSDRPRAQSLYLSSIIRLFNDMKDYYNDEDNGIIQIHQTLKKFTVPRQNVAKKRALPVEKIRSIFALPYDNIKVKGEQSRHDLALDCFRLSFCLMGMNSIDLYKAKDYRKGVISYCREKTKDRRNDMAFMQVEVQDYIKPLVEKYRDDEWVFNFYRRFSTAQNFNRAINIGLKKVGRELGIENLQFYAARHSMASIAVNRAGIDRWTVNAMLNHTDTSMRVTELYIERDFEPLNKANRKLLDYVFGENA